MKRRVVSILLSTVMAVTLLSGCEFLDNEKDRFRRKNRKKIGRGCRDEYCQMKL